MKKNKQDTILNMLQNLFKNCVMVTFVSDFLFTKNNYFQFVKLLIYLS